MTVKNKATALLGFGAMLALILDSSASIYGCRQGIELCTKSVIPALLPFLVLSPMLTSSMRLQLPGWLHRLLKIPDGADALWITGCLGGYPVGAQCIAQAADGGQITGEDAKRLMAFCCNCGPGFVFGICSSFFTAQWAAWGLWLCHIAGSMVMGWLLPGKHGQARLSPSKEISFIDAFTRGLRAMAQICGWVILFRCVLEFLRRWVLFRLSIPLQVIISGMLELTNGCLALSSIANEALRFIICEAMLCFGGLCVAMQTASVGRKAPLGLYLPGKLGQTAISTLLAAALWAVMHSNWSIALGIAALFLTILCAMRLICKNFSRNFWPVGV